MKIKTIKIPIYQCSLTIILDKDLSYVEKIYNTKSLKDYGAVTMRKPNAFSEYIVAFEYSTGSIIAHEVVHLVNYIFSDRNVELDRFNDEPQAYLTGWLFDEIDNFINSAEKDKKQRNDK
jgi:hypothetical protein